MSAHPPNDHGHEAHGRESGDEIDYFKVIGIGVASLAIFAAATWWAAIILKRETGRVQEDWGETTTPTEIGKAEIGIVDQVPFTTDRRLDVWRKEQADHLGSYGWVDRTRGIAHIPIEEAMEKVAGGALPAGAPK